MRKILFEIYLLFFFVGIAQPILSQSPYYYYKQLGIKEGLSQSKVQCVLNDHRGYLWIGTESGLNCYDRDHLKQYLHRPGDERTLPSNKGVIVSELYLIMVNRSMLLPIYWLKGESYWEDQELYTNMSMPLISWNLCIMRKTLFITIPFGR